MLNATIDSESVIIIERVPLYATKALTCSSLCYCSQKIHISHMRYHSRGVYELAVDPHVCKGLLQLQYDTYLI